jgi:sugar phosphate isomerase/epimerase
LKVGIDNYSYHRYFGEIYPGTPEPEKRWGLEDFLKQAKKLEVDGVSLESCFFPRHEKSYMMEIKAMLDQYGFERVYAWGHPGGLEAGSCAEKFQEMLEHIEFAAMINANVMRVVASSLNFRFQPHGPQLRILVDWFKQAVEKAEDYGVKIAIENHIDYDSDEILYLVEAVNSTYFGVNFDTGNFVRVLDDPVEAMNKLAPYTFSVHMKDLKPNKGTSVKDWCFFSCTPVGAGIVDNRKIMQILKDNDYQGFLAVEMDYMHPDYGWNEADAVEVSIKELKRIISNLKFSSFVR